MKKRISSLMQPLVSIRGDKGALDVVALVDTGASYSFVRESIAQQIASVFALPEPMLFTLADGSTLTIDKTCVLTCYIDGMTITDSVLVQPDALSVDELILGAATLRKYGIKLDLGRNEMYARLTITDKPTVQEDSRMHDTLKSLLAKLGIAEQSGWTDEHAMAAIVAKAQAQTPPSVAAPAVLALLELTDTATESEVKGKIMALKNPGNVVPVAEINALKSQLHEREISDAVNGALAEGKITPAEKTWAVEEATKDLLAFRSFLAHRPQQTPLTDRLPAAPGRAAALGSQEQDADAAQRLILAVMQESKTKGRELTYKDAAIEAARRQPSLFQL